MVGIAELPPIRAAAFDQIPSPNFSQNDLALGIRPICSPVSPDSCMKLSDYPSLSAFRCTSCGASGSGPLEYHKSNPGKWGGEFVWVYCMRCMSAFGTINGDVLRTYKSSPKPNSPTARTQTERGVANSESLPVVRATPLTSTTGDGRNFLKGDTLRGNSAITTLPTTPTIIRRDSVNDSMQNTSRNPFMTTHFPLSSASFNRGSFSPVIGPRAKPAKEGADSGSDADLPLTQVMRHKRNLDIIVQMADCEVFTMRLMVTGSILEFKDLPELLRSHLQASGASRALELLLAKGGAWTPFGSKDSRVLNPRIETIYGRVVSSKPASPHEILVLESDTEENQNEEEEEEGELVQTKRRRVSADAKAKAKVAPKKTRSRKTD